MSLAGAVRWTLSSRIFTSIVSVGAPGMANSTISLCFSASAYATVLGATLIRYSGILATSLVVSNLSLISDLVVDYSPGWNPKGTLYDLGEYSGFVWSGQMQVVGDLLTARDLWSPDPCSRACVAKISGRGGP